MITNPLRIGEMASTHFVPGEHWKDLFLRKSPDGLDGVKVSEMRSWIDWGLPPILEDLIILACAAQMNCSFMLHGSPYRPKLRDLPDECRLKTQELPSATEWEAAMEIQDAILGRADLPRLLSATSLQDFSTKVRNRLETEASRQGLEDDFDRLISAREAKRFLSLVKANEGCALVRALAGFTSDQPKEAISTSIKGTEPVLHALPIDRRNLDLALTFDSPLKEEAEALEQELLKALRRNEYVVALEPVVKKVQDGAFAIVARKVVKSGAGDPREDRPSTRTGGEGGTPPSGGESGDGSSASPRKRSGAWAGSDEAEIRAKYGSDQAAIDRNRKLVGELKALYGASQVEGDALPGWLPESLVDLVLEVHHVEPLSKGGADERSNMIVLTPTLHALVHACEDAVIDLKDGVLSIPSRGIERKITVKDGHNG
jgi:hypothetical protein